MNTGFLEANNITSLITTVRNNVKQEINYDITQEPKYINVLKKLVKTIHKANINKNVSTQYMNDLVVTKCVPFLVNQIEKSNKDYSKLPRGNVYGDLPLNSSFRPEATRTKDAGLEKANSLPKRDQTDFSNLVLGNDGGMSLNEANTPDNFRNLEPPPRQMPQLSNNSQGRMDIPGGNPNIQMDIANLPAPMPNSSDFDNMPIVSRANDRETQNFVENLPGISSKDIDENIDFAKRLEEMQRERDYSTPQIKKEEENVLKEREIKIEQNNDQFFQKLAENNKVETPSSNERDETLALMNSTNLNRNYMETDVSNYTLDDSAYSAYENNRIQLGPQNASQARDLSSNFENNIRDQNQNVDSREEVNSGISDIVEKKDNEFKKDFSKDYVEQTFLPTNYQFERRKRKIVCLDISDNLANLTIDGSNTKKVVENISDTYWGRFRVHLQDDFIVDKTSDVFIESIIINNPAQASRFSNLYIVVDIEEFNIKTATNNNHMIDKFVLPNENTDSAGSTKIMKYHLKSNYVATVNPTTLSSLTFNLTNEDGESVQSDFTSSGKTLSANLVVGTSAGGNIGLAASAGASTFNILDAVYNSSQQFVGNVLATVTIADDTAGNIQFMRGTNVHLINGETLFFPSSRTTLLVNEAANGGALVDETELTLDSDPRTIFSVGDTVYLGTGAVIGRVSATSADTITFEKGVTQYIPNGAALYTSNPLPRVFASNEKSNRIILELVIMSR